jgi:Tfp pilus assembly protein PilN
MRYNINLVRLMRSEERKAVELRNRLSIVGLSCMGLLGLAAITFTFQVIGMEAKLNNERLELARIEMAYSKYKTTRMVIDKADIERLDSLQTNRIFWTKKLAVMANYLPDDYWIVHFSSDSKAYRVAGFGYISPKQVQLITIDDYLNKIRADSSYKDVFKTTYVNSVSRSDEDNARDNSQEQRVSFNYTSIQ